MNQNSSNLASQSPGTSQLPGAYFPSHGQGRSVEESPRKHTSNPCSCHIARESYNQTQQQLGGSMLLGGRGNGYWPNFSKSCLYFIDVYLQVLYATAHVWVWDVYTVSREGLMMSCLYGGGGFTTIKSKFGFCRDFCCFILFFWEGVVVVYFEKQNSNTISQGICIVIFLLDVQLGRL